MLTNLMVLMIAVAYGLVNGQITRNPLCPRGGEYNTGDIAILILRNSVIVLIQQGIDE